MAATVRGVRNHNPGNIDRVKGVTWQGQAAKQTDRRFVVFTAPEWGIRAIARVLITYQDKRTSNNGTKIDTIREIIDRWAPAVENDTAAYIGHVSRLIGIGADEEVDVYRYEVMRPLVEAIIAHECAGYRYDEATINEGLRMAGIKVPLPPLAGSRTVAAGRAAIPSAVGVGGIVALLDEARAPLQEIAYYLDWAKYALLAITLIGLGVMLYARWDDGRKARR